MIFTVLQVQEAVAAHLGVTVAALCGPDRHHNIAFARHIAMFVARNHTPSSYPDLGRAFGNRDHSTVISAVRGIVKRLGEEPDLRTVIAEIEGRLMKRAS